MLRLISRLEGILSSEKKLIAVIKKEILEIRDRFGDDRRTQIIPDDAGTLPEPDEKPEPEETVFMLTRGGQARRMAPKVFEKSEWKALEELPRFLLRIRTDHTLYFFTDAGNCYPVPVTAVPDISRPKDRGLTLSGLLMGLEDGEQVVRILSAAEGDIAGCGDLLFVTAQGMIKRTAASEYAVRKAKFASINLRAGDRVQALHVCADEPEMLLISQNAMSIRFSLDGVPVTGRTTGGVKAMALDAGDAVVFSAPVSAEGEAVVFSDRGYAKRVLLVDFDLQNRNGKGLRVFTFNKNGSNGSRVAGALYVREPYDFRVFQQGAEVSELNTDAVMIEPRASKGRPYVMALMDDVVTEVAKITL